MRWNLHRGVTIGALTALVVAGSMGARLTQQPASSTTANAAGANADWPSFGGNDDNTRYSPLDQINASNVSKLGIAWTAAEGKNLSAFETVPLVVNGTMYYTTDTDQVRAVNAATGKLLWQYTPKVDFYRSIAGGGGGVPINRGVTLVNGVVYAVTFDARLIALQASTGEKLWETNVADPNAGYAESSPATYYNGLLFVGSEEGDAGQRGFEAAFNAKTGKQVWKFYTVPAPGHGWMPATGDHGGGDVWMPAVVDPTLGLVYIGTGNPSPDFNNVDRPGCNQWANATVALNAMTGKFVWGHTEFCNDVWDYDSHQAPILFNMTINGKNTRVVGHGNKAGQYFIYNAKTGAVIAHSPFLGGYSKPHLKPNPAGVKVCPGSSGGIEYGPPAFSPQTGYVYQPSQTECQIFKTIPIVDTNAHQPGQVDTGGSAAATGKISGAMNAIDPKTGKVLWKTSFSKPLTAGALATAGGLVFAGADDGHLYAFDAKTGKVLWSPNLGLGFGAPPIAYQINGTEYIAVAVGGNLISAGDNIPLGGTLAVFKLGGSPIKKLPAVTNGNTVPVALPSLAGYKQVAKHVYVNAAKHHVILQMVAGETSANNGFNYNGYYNGQATYTVPVHWSVDIEFKNLAALPHSIGIGDSHMPPPKLETFGFAPVLSANATAGTLNKTYQLLGFAADHTGSFYLDCLVPGHLQSGMWDNLVVSATATTASFTTS